MDFLQNIDANTILLVIVGGCGLCIVGIILLFAFQLVGGVLEAFGSITDIIGNVLGGGPIGGCGCFLVLGGCGFCGVLIFLAASALNDCGANPTNFCALLGR